MLQRSEGRDIRGASRGLTGVIGKGLEMAPSQASNRRRLKTPPVLDTDPVSFAMHSSTNGRSGRGSRGARVSLGVLRSRIDHSQAPHACHQPMWFTVRG